MRCAHHRIAHLRYPCASTNCSKECWERQGPFQSNATPGTCFVFELPTCDFCKDLNYRCEKTGASNPVQDCNDDGLVFHLKREIKNADSTIQPCAPWCAPAVTDVGYEAKKLADSYYVDDGVNVIRKKCKVKDVVATP